MIFGKCYPRGGCRFSQVEGIIMKEQRYNRRNFLSCLGIGAAAVLTATRVQAKRPPNIVFIYTDDQAAWTLGVSGNAQAKTPNMDRLAQEGARLTNAFVTTPVCSPARASLLTSRYGTELGILDFIPHPEHSIYTPALSDTGLDPKLVTFPEALADAGYKTGLVGKFHVGDWTKDPEKRFHPTNQGFSYFMGLTGGGASPENPSLERDGVVSTVKGLTTDILADDAIKFVHENKDQPFLLCLHHRAPHAKWLPVSDSDWAPYAEMDPKIPNPDYPDLDTDKVKRMTREYLASVRGVDRNLGRLLDTLDALNLRENTIVIFSSDNGYNMGHNGIWHKGNGIWATKHLPPATEHIDNKYRPNLYDNSLRVPVIVRWPGVIKAGTLVSETVSSLDWYPTLLSMAGVALPTDVLIRGRDFLPLLKGEAVDGWDNDLYAEYSMEHYCQTHMRAYRTPKWKLVRDFLTPERDELYDLERDPAESVNRIHDASPEVRRIIQELHAKILEHMRKTNDPALELAEKRSGR